MIRRISYKKFSFNTHKKNWQINRPNACQFELTFRCGLHCKHCYTDCYNKPKYAKKELPTQDVLLILDKIYDAGIIWVCFTGGDPLIRKDFLDIYSYAKNKGFIVTVFTNLYSMNRNILNAFKKKPPFVIEFTLNAITNDLYNKISQVQGSFKKVMQNLNLALDANLPLKIKTQITKENFHEFSKIKKFIESKKLSFMPNVDLFPRLNGNLFPCTLRLSKNELFQLAGYSEQCQYSKSMDELNKHVSHKVPLFRCAINGDGLYVDPYGNTFLCHLIRRPSYNLLNFDIEYIQRQRFKSIKNKYFVTDSKCKTCNIIQSCHKCPGKAYLETENSEAPIKYYCELAEIALLDK